MPTPTEPSVLKADFRASILAICPTHPEYRNAKWAYVNGQRQVGGSTLRTFHVSMGPGHSTLEGIQSPEGGEWEIEVSIWVSYQGLGTDYDDSIITNDSVDLWKAIRNRYGLLDGFISIVHSDPSWEPADDDAGRKWGAHLFTLRYIQSV